MVVRNAVSHDTRVLREADALSKAGFEVTIFGMRLRDTEEEDWHGDVHIVRITPAGASVRVFDALSRNSKRYDRKARAMKRRLGRKRRALVARLRRQWTLLVQGGTPGSTLVVMGQAIRTPRRAVITLPLFPFALARTLFFRRAPSAVLVTADAPLAEPEQADSTKARRVTRFVARIDRARLHLTRLAFQRRAAEAMAALEPVAYHCHDFNTLYAGRLAAKKHRAPVVYDSHEIYLHRNLATHSKMATKMFGIIEGWLMRRAAAVITVNDSIAEYLAKHYRVAVPKVVRNMPASGPKPAEVEIPEVFSRPGTKVLYLGGITLGRGIEEAIAAIGHIPDASLIMMGPVVREQYRETFRELADASGAGDRIFILPAVPPEHIRYIIGAADVGLSVLLNASLNNYYSLPNKLFSYIEAGVPVLASDFPELRRIVEGYGIGLVTDPDDPRAIADAITSIAGDPAIHEKYRAATREAAKVLTWEHESEQLVSIYSTICS